MYNLNTQHIVPWSCRTLRRCQPAAGKRAWAHRTAAPAQKLSLGSPLCRTCSPGSAGPPTHSASPAPPWNNTGHVLQEIQPADGKKNVSTSIKYAISIDMDTYVLTNKHLIQISHLKEMVLRALSATARACSIWVACRWWAMYCSQSKELLGEPSSKRSKAAESWGRRLGSISWASRSTRAFSAAFFSCSSSWRVFFWGWQTRKKLSVEFDGRKCLDTEKETDKVVLGASSPCCFCLGPLHRWNPPPPLQTQASGSSVLRPKRNLLPPVVWMDPLSFASPAERHKVESIFEVLDNDTWSMEIYDWTAAYLHLQRQIWALLHLLLLWSIPPLRCHCHQSLLSLSSSSFSLGPLPVSGT